MGSGARLELGVPFLVVRTELALARDERFGLGAGDVQLRRNPPLLGRISPLPLGVRVRARVRGRARGRGRGRVWIWAWVGTGVRLRARGKVRVWNT